MGFRFEDLDALAFERLVVEYMRKLFGAGVQEFAAGQDGGRDARFQGTAELFPSTTSPWSGLVVGQAKHTAAINAHFSDADFSSTTKSSVISKEIERLKKLKAKDELEYYILFSNRRLGGVVGPEIELRIATAVGLTKDRVHCVGVERMDQLLLQFRGVLDLARISPIDGPLLVNSDDLAEIILAIARHLPPVDPSNPVARVPFDEKNELNNMSADFAQELSTRYLSDTQRIGAFLAAPENDEILARYQATVEDFQLKITAKRTDDQSFDDVFNYLVDTLTHRDPVLGARGRPQLVRMMLFYMYWHCDIGKQP